MPKEHIKLLPGDGSDRRWYLVHEQLQTADHETPYAYAFYEKDTQEGREGLTVSGPFTAANMLELRNPDASWPDAPGAMDLAYTSEMHQFPIEDERLGELARTLAAQLFELVLPEE